MQISLVLLAFESIFKSENYSKCLGFLLKQECLTYIHFLHRVFRYATFSTILLMTAYGISQTPLFFRYKSIEQIPSSFFRKRKRLYGRLVHVVEREKKQRNHYGANDSHVSNVEEEPITCYIRHLTPVERLLNRNYFDFILGKQNDGVNDSSADEVRRKDLLKVEIAGIIHPLIRYDATAHMEEEGGWLRSLARSRSPVALQLISRRSNKTQKVNERKFQGASECVSSAICNVKYRPGGAIFRKDLAESLVRYGRSDITSSGVHSSANTDEQNTIECTTSDIKKIRADAAYMERLGELQIEAIREKVGMWADENLRSHKRYEDLVAEVESEANAGLWTKFWSWFRNR